MNERLTHKFDKYVPIECVLFGKDGPIIYRINKEVQYFYKTRRISVFFKLKLTVGYSSNHSYLISKDLKLERSVERNNINCDMLDPLTYVNK